MRNVILLIILLLSLLYSCNNNTKVNDSSNQAIDRINMNTNLMKNSAQDIKSINDSIVQLISIFQQKQDSTALKLALVLNDKAIALDSLNKDQFYNLNTRIQILGLLNRYKEAFLLKEKILSKDKLNIDRLIYYGQKYKLKGQADSSEVYFNEAIIQCDKLLNDTLNTDIVLKKIEVYIYQNKVEDAKIILNQALQKSPDNETLMSLRENFGEYYKIVNDLFQKIKL